MNSAGSRAAKLAAGGVGLALVGYAISTGYLDIRPNHLMYSYGGRLHLPWPLLLTFLVGYLMGSAVPASPNTELIVSDDADAGIMGSYSHSDNSSRSYAQSLAGITAGIIVTAGCIALSVAVHS